MMAKKLTKRQRAARVRRSRQDRSRVLELLNIGDRITALKFRREINWLLRYGGLRSI